MARCEDNHTSRLAGCTRRDSGNGIMLLMKCLTQTSGAARNMICLRRTTLEILLGLTTLDEQMVPHLLLEKVIFNMYNACREQRAGRHNTII